jgi:hypothetical protein
VQLFLVPCRIFFTHSVDSVDTYLYKVTVELDFIKKKNVRVQEMLTKGFACLYIIVLLV